MSWIPGLDVRLHGGQDPSICEHTALLVALPPAGMWGSLGLGFVQGAGRAEVFRKAAEVFQETQGVPVGVCVGGCPSPRPLGLLSLCAIPGETWVLTIGLALG